MIQIPNNKKLVNMLTVLTVAGEMPLVAASQAGSHEGYRKLFYELSKKQIFINTKTNEQMRVKLIHMSDRGDKRRCRLYKNAIPILDWIGTRAYYEEMFPDNKMSGGEQNRFSNAMVAEAVLMMLESGVEVLPTMLPVLRINNRYNSFDRRSCFYSARQLKQTLNKGINKIVSSRIVGALFAGNNVYAVYNTRSSAIKWKGMNEMKTKHILTDLARVNGDIPVCDSAVIFGKDDWTVLKSFFNATAYGDKDFRFDKIYPNVYAIPQNPIGIELLKLFKIPNFQQKILAYMFEEKDICQNSGYGWHAVVDGAYVFSYLDANIASLTRFYETAKRGKGKHKFTVVCYDFQETFIKDYFEDIASIATMPFQEIINNITGVVT